MRVIAGSLGGRRLSAPRGQERTRPTSDRVREALFATLGEIEDASVLDLFAGTGALGIEALSRGASSALFVERDRAALQVLRENLEALELLAPRARVRAGEALAALRAARRRGETYDLVFLDPPYGQAGELEGPLSATLPAILEPAARVVVESDRRSPLVLEPLAPLREKRYGDTLITIYSHQVPSGIEQEPRA
ncbi:MAG TPA: 16S rRNA (guanine(966)-N(2))-methyltransferase RsmD [Solirubrobacteraceae bacterium]|nr:16S rRNA (guanine(966)-N(2))-methyltransferase RsmD [Solirubrobacteraceae bacterium]